MKQKLFNVVVYGMLAFSLINTGYLALPPEVQAMIPQYNDMVAIIGGASSGLFALGGMTVQSYINRAKEQADAKFQLLAQNYLNIERKYDVNTESVNKQTKAIELLTREQQRTNKLIEVDLQAKLSNPMIDEQIKTLIEDVMKDE